MAQVLIIDDDKIFASLLAEVVTEMGHLPMMTFNLRDGLKEAKAVNFQVILLDVNLPDGSGLTQMPRLRDLCPSAEIIIITAYGDRNGAELALESGAWDYIQKTDSVSKVNLSLARAIQYVETSRNGEAVIPDIDLEGIIGRSLKLRTCFRRLAQAARSAASVLISGETGTGKELFARAVHRNSKRAAGPFVTVDCASLTPTLVESQLFGHEKGAFTGADRKMDGLITQANGGTLFLDEIGELPLLVQNAFLRVLQDKRYRPVGGSRELESDFRTVAATNRNLAAMAASGAFRGDLLYRLRSLSIELPPLREHPEDIPELALFYTAKLCRRYGIPVKSISPEYLEHLAVYTWPGNIRDLVNSMEGAIADSFDEPVLYPKHLPTNIRLHFINSDNSDNGDILPRQFLPTLKNAREAAVIKAEEQYLRRLMREVNGDIQEGCRLSGLSRPQLYAQLKKHNIAGKDHSRSR